MTKWTVYHACMVVEGVEEGDELGAWQYLLDTGACWRLQGWYGRAAAQLIEAGLIRVRKEGEQDETLHR